MTFHSFAQSLIDEFSDQISTIDFGYKLIDEDKSTFIFFRKY